MPGPRVTLYHAAGCHLCDSARGVLARLATQAAFELEEVDITAVPELEAVYREWLPVVEIEGERAFVYYVQPEPFLRKLARHEVGSS
ncbi:MAG: glutaredoxin family protein [Deltaproteobacteria bacterium]|nr:glutaredoxin family protein [Deltaproteobacteria bacterium]